MFCYILCSLEFVACFNVCVCVCVCVCVRARACVSWLVRLVERMIIIEVIFFFFCGPFFLTCTCTHLQTALTWNPLLKSLSLSPSQPLSIQPLRCPPLALDPRTRGQLLSLLAAAARMKGRPKKG